ncbi:hypothetical protein OIDMADRAFT_182195 [Oidiodendron maius Zn]|uniref:Protein kinase domain-containing protein n=1 Tax=Oidiodendron maius (strain Zn) TaxID=913774 RepID=A0A0C3D7E5_OIDMZ|nr:hypothetical protein OIDMADRAFT_182195 [Oidiodendron maius Zn]
MTRKKLQSSSSSESFRPDTVFSVSQCKKILLGIACISGHLHAHKITHGDLYAHNILIGTLGCAFPRYFGAATICGTQLVKKQAFERTEVLAFNYLAEDLLSLVGRQVDDEGEFFEEKDVSVIEELNLLHYKCSNPGVQERPVFVEIREVLEGL